jgi:hypothetical protein
MARNEREKTVAVCEVCGAVCAAWVLPDGAVVPVSATVDCECEEPTLRALDGLEKLSDG